MKLVYKILITALLLAAPNVSVASIVCTPAICQTITQTVSNGQYLAATIPAGVPTLSFYARGGAGATAYGSGGYLNPGSGGGGGGGACAYTSSWGYILCVGGGGGGFTDAPYGGGFFGAKER